MPDRNGASSSSFLKLAVKPFLLIAMLAVSYIALFHNDAAINVEFVRKLLGTAGLYGFDAFLIVLVIPIALVLMEIITGEFGLLRFKRIVAISAGMTVLGFSALQFIGAIATSSAEGATVMVEVVQQIAYFTQHHELEQYGLVGMLTSDASGPWNSSIFPLIILVVWFLKKKYVGMETKQLHIPMIMQWVLYAQQFLFGLDLQYTLFEIILMGITGTLFVWGMLSFLVPMFKKAEEAEKQAASEANNNQEVKKEQSKNLYRRLIGWPARSSFEILTYNPWNIRVDIADKSVAQKRGGFGQVKRAYVVLNALQLTIAMTMAMFFLVIALQFLAIQLKISAAGAALFGTAGLTSAPEALVAMTAGPYINSLLLVGSNIIDGWMSAIGQIVLLSYAEIVSGGTITAIPLHPAIRLLTFLSWTQGMLVWAFLALYAHNINRVKQKSLLLLVTVIGLLGSVVYYFGGAWYSAQALAYGAQYALNSFVYKSLSSIVDFFAAGYAQQIALSFNIVGLGMLTFWWSGITKKLTSIAQGAGSQTIDQATRKLKQIIGKHLKREDQQVVIVLDKSADMDKKGKLFANRWIDLVFTQTAALGLILDDDAYIPVYVVSEDSVEQIPNLLTNKNADGFIEKYVGRKTSGKMTYAPVLKKIYHEYKKYLTEKHDPVLVLFITAGEGEDNKELEKILREMSNMPIFVQFLAIYGDKPPSRLSVLEEAEKTPGRIIDNAGLASLPLFALTDAKQIVKDVLNEYPKYLKVAEEKGMLREPKA